MTTTDLTDATIETIAAAGGLGRMSYAQGLAAHGAAERAIRPLMPLRMHGWLVRPMARESARAYARRAVRYAIARCAAAGMATPLRHSDSETIAMAASHGSVMRAGYRIVDTLELASQDRDAE